MGMGNYKISKARMAEMREEEKKSHNILLMQIDKAGGALVEKASDGTRIVCTRKGSAVITTYLHNEKSATGFYQDYSVFDPFANPPFFAYGSVELTSNKFPLENLKNKSALEKIITLNRYSSRINKRLNEIKGTAEDFLKYCFKKGFKGGVRIPEIIVIRKGDWLSKISKSRWGTINWKKHFKATSFTLEKRKNLKRPFKPDLIYPGDTFEVIK